jgi:hypothetical protein
MAMIAPAFSLGRPTRLCHATGRALRDGEPYIAVLLDTPGDAPSAPPARVDFSTEGWSGLADHRRIDGVDVLAFWRASLASTDPRPNAPLLDDGALTDLFEQTGETLDSAPGQDPSTTVRRTALRFVVCLLMLRRKLLVLESIRRGTMLVRPRGTPRPPEGPPLLEVVDPELEESTIAEVLAELTGDASTSCPPADAAPAGAQ